MMLNPKAWTKDYPKKDGWYWVIAVHTSLFVDEKRLVAARLCTPKRKRIPWIQLDFDPRGRQAQYQVTSARAKKIVEWYGPRIELPPCRTV